jgi:protein SCO1/2
MSTETRRQFRWTDWPVLLLAGLVGLLAILVVLYVATKPGAPPQENAYAAFARDIDEVVLIGADGAPVRWGDLNGKPRLVFFGFTRCPEICPTTVAELSAAIEALGPDAADVEVAFISVDPARDTPDVLSAYFSSFGPRFHGYSGDRAEIDRIVRAFRVFYEHVPTSGGDYTVNHTAITYLVSAEGEVVDIIGYGNPHDRTIAQLRTFLSSRRA